LSEPGSRPGRDRAPRRLLSGPDLRDADRRAREHDADLAPAERAYLAAANRRRHRHTARLAVALVATVLTYRTVDERRAGIAAGDMAAKSTRLRGYDRYGGLRLALRAYRADAGRCPKRSVPTVVASPSRNPPGAW
jgi:hypothetical protein